MTIFTEGDRTPFTYLIKCIPTGELYYGVRYAKGCQPSDLWTTYFTSSKKVKDRIKIYGINAFELEIRRTFQCAQQARSWEHTVLIRMKVISDPKWLNNHIGCSYVHRSTNMGFKSVYIINENRYSLMDPQTAQRFVDAGLAIFKGKPRDPEASKATSIALKGRPKSETHVKNMLASVLNSRNNKGRKRYTNGTKDIVLKESALIPEGFQPGSCYERCRPPSTKGKTYEEMYGVDKAQELKQDRSIKLKQNNKNFKFKGLTYEQIHGEKKAIELRAQKAKSKFKTYQLWCGDQCVFTGSRDELIAYFISTYDQKSALYRKEWLRSQGLRVETQYMHRSLNPR